MNSLRYCLKYPQNKFLLAINITCFVIFCYSVTHWYLINSKEKLLQSKVTAKAVEVREKIQLVELNDAYMSAVKTLAIIEKSSQQKISQSNLVNALDSLAQKNGINIISQDFEKPQIKDKETHLLLSLNIEANYLSMRKFLKEFEKISVLSAIEEATITRLRASTNQVQAMLKITFYDTENPPKEELL